MFKYFAVADMPSGYGDCAVWPRHSWATAAAIRATKAPPAENRKVGRHCEHFKRWNSSRGLSGSW